MIETPTLRCQLDDTPDELVVLLRHYTRHVFGLESANLQATARRLNLDRRTVQSKLMTGQGDAS